MSRSRPIFFFLAATALTALPALLTGACSAASNQFFSGAGGSGASGQGPSGSGGTSNPVSSSAGIGGGFLFDAGNDDGSAGGDPTTCAEAASAKAYIGCDFWPTVVANNVWSIFDYAVVVANAGTQAADVTVTRNGATIASGTVQPNALETLYLPWVPELKGPDSDNCGSVMPLAATVRAPGGAYHLVSSVPVTVYQFNALEYQGQGGPPGKNWSSCPGNRICDSSFSAVGCFSFTNDASLLLPSTAMTGNYRVAGQAGWPLAAMGSYFAVTGTTDNTMVTVYVSPTGHVLGGGGVPDTQANGSFVFSLNAGDVVEIDGDANSDLSGSLVAASAPVQVVSGMPCVYQPFSSGACDHIEESVFPAETLGKHYFVTPPTGPNGDVPGHIVRIFGNVDGTNLSYPGGAPQGAPATINAGQVVDLGIVAQDFEITGDHEFIVGSFMLGASIVDPNDIGTMQKGDPSMSFFASVEQYRTKYVFLAPSDYDISFVDVVLPTGTAVTLDGAPLSGNVTTISSGFSVTRVQLGAGNNGAHVLTAAAPVAIQIMGYGSFTSYQYPGGLNLNSIAPPPMPPH